MFQVLSKLALKNVKRSFKDYVIYFITVTLAFSLMLAFNFIATSKDVINLSDTMKNFEGTMYIVNTFIILSICFLINYTTKFMFSKRSREFGTYMILGLKKKQITRMFTLENIILGLISLVVAMPLGYFFSILLSAIIMNFFELPHLVKITLNIKAILILILYFAIIYFIVLFLSRRRIKKMKIKDLLYFYKQNEKPIAKKKLKNITFILSLIIGICALVFFDKEFRGGGHEPSMLVIFTSIFLILISIYGISITLSDFLLSFILRHKKVKYKGNNLFIVRNFYSKVKSMSFTIGTLSFLITITLIALNISSFFKGMFDYQIDTIATYDIAIEDEREKFSTYLDAIYKEYTISDKLIYDTYINDNKSISKIIKYDGWRENERVIKLSDYNKLLRLKKSPIIKLKDNEYILHVAREYKDKLKEARSLESITLSNGVELKKRDFIEQGYSFSWGYGYGYLVVVPDSAVEGLAVGDSHLIVDTLEDTTESFAKDLTKIASPDMCRENEAGYTMCYSIANVIVRGKEEASNKGFMTISSFVCFYVALIFVAIVGTIISIELLSESTKYKYRYQVLSKLGLRDGELYKTVFKQLSVFFIFPIIYPIIVSIFSITSMNKLFKVTLTSDYQYLQFFWFNLLIFVVFYLIYFVATYFGFKKNISE